MKFTKHFYIEGQRIVSKLGDMGKNQDLLNPKDTTRAGNNGNHPIDWDNKHEHLKDQLIANFEELGLTGAVFYSPNNYFNGVRELASLGSAGKSGKITYGQRRSPREHIKNKQSCEHTFIEERNGTDYTNYLYNGKEFDEEIGLYYYGARYYDPRISMFYGVDPLVEKYSFQSPYAYAVNNPIRFIDWMGMEPIDENANKVDKTNQVTPAIDNSLDGAPGGKREGQFRDDQISISPVENPVISSEYGSREAPIAGASTNHKGIDIVQKKPADNSGTPVVAPKNGKIIAMNSKSDNNGAGNRIHLKANTGEIHSVFHMHDNEFGDGLQVGQKVSRGQQLGQIGNTGNSGGAHAHYEIRNKLGGTPSNPRTANSGLKYAPTTNEARKQQVIPTISSNSGRLSISY